MEEVSVTTIVAWAAFAAGIVFGATANKTNFCTMGAISDVIFMGDYRRLRAWFLAIAVAIIGSQALQALGLVDLTGSIYLTSNFGWAGAILGGFIFGFGMTMASGCSNKTLVRIGGGNLKSVMVFLVLGIFAYMTLRGLIGLARVQLEQAANVDLTGMGLTSQGLGEMAATVFGVDRDVMQWVVTAIVGGGLLIYCFKDAAFRSSRRDIAAGLIIGALVPAGWYITGVVGYDDFEPTQIASFTFVAPTGESIQYLMTFTGATINFGIAAVGGVIVGSFLMAVATRSFAVESFTDTSDMVRHIVGGALMGVGGVLALGCTIGQGITGMSTLALGSVLALVSIIVGGIYGMKYLEEGSIGGALRAVLSRG
jgi:uncharacterized membrane protein YedE/YeeE